MKAFFASVRKEFLHIFRDKRTILIVMIMPVVQIVLFGFAVSTEVNRARVAVCGEISDLQVRRITDRIDKNRYLEITEILSTPEEIEGLFRRNEADAAVCFERNFSSGLTGSGGASVRIIGDGSDPNTARMITSYISGVIQDAGQDASISLSGEKAASMTPSVQLMYNPAMKSSYNFVPGVMGLILMLIWSMMTAVSIVKEKETGTLELLLVSPVRPLTAVTCTAGTAPTCSIALYTVSDGSLPAISRTVSAEKVHPSKEAEAPSSSTERNSSESSPTCMSRT